VEEGKIVTEKFDNLIIYLCKIVLVTILLAIALDYMWLFILGPVFKIKPLLFWWDYIIIIVFFKSILLFAKWDVFKKCI
jgi:hypothetical protein